MINLQKQVMVLATGILLLLVLPCHSYAEDLIMPLGDSITRGVSGDTNSFGYRDHLQDDLGIGEYNFVGPHTDPNSSGTYDVDHAGVNGERTDEVESRISAQLDTYMPSPNSVNSCVLLFVGTNDIGQDYGSGTQDEKLNSYVDNVEDIIDIIHAHDANIQVHVALITPNTNGTTDAIVTSYNSKLNTMLSAYNKSNLYTVDMNTAFKNNGSWATAYMDDDAHPNDTGYDLMAATWYTSIDNRYQNTTVYKTITALRSGTGATITPLRVGTGVTMN